MWQPACLLKNLLRTCRNYVVINCIKLYIQLTLKLKTSLEFAIDILFLRESILKGQTS